MVTKPARMGGAIWLYKQPFQHRILRFVLLQRRHRSSLVYETRSLLTVDQSLQRIKTFSADFPADSPLSSHFRACSSCSLTVPCRQPATWCNLVTKTTAQAIGRSMASLVVFERHLWLTLTEMKDADKIPFLDSPVSPTGLFGPAVEGLVERFTAAQKSSQAMRHFLPKRSSSAAGSSRPRSVPTPQLAKPAPPATQPEPKPAPRECSRSARRHQSPKRQGTRPKIVLDLAPKASS